MFFSFFLFSFPTTICPHVYVISRALLRKDRTEKLLEESSIEVIKVYVTHSIH